MSSAERVRATCQSCQTIGRFRPIEVMLHEGGAWRWYLRILCAVCALHLLELVTERGGRGRPRRQVTASAAVAEVRLEAV